MAVDANGQIDVMDSLALPQGGGIKGAVIRVDPNTGAQTTVSSSSLFHDPFGIAIVPPMCAGRYATIVGDPTANRLVGSPFADVIVGLGANDKLIGGAGKDIICGGPGRDVLKGGKGKDTLLGQAGRDKLIGGKGKYRLKGGKGRDIVKQ